jgi:hypothetical protein
MNCSPVSNGFVPGFVLAVDRYEHEWESNDITNIKEIGFEDSDRTEISDRFCWDIRQSHITEERIRHLSPWIEMI